MNRKLLTFVTAAAMALCLTSCDRPKGPAGRAAWDFMDAYYVKADLKDSERYCDGVALEKVKAGSELRDGQVIDKAAHHPLVTFKTIPSKEAPDKQSEASPETSKDATYLFLVTVKPDKADPIQKKTRVKVRQREGGEWKVTQFSDADF